MSSNPKNLSAAAIAQTLTSLQRVIVVSHYNPDADAYGSSCGLALALQEAGKEVICINESGQVPRYAFLPGVDKVQNQIPNGSFDGVIACDCGDARRVGDTFREKLLGFPIVINIDHHKSNDFFGTHNWVESGASSTCEMVFQILQETGHPLSAASATCLFAGISGDTGSFRYSNTSEKTFAIAQQLLRAGAKPGDIATALYSSDSLSSVKLQAEALRNVRILSEGRVALVIVTDEMMAEFQATPDDTEALVEKARNIEGVQVSVLLRQEQGVWKGSLRSKSSRYDMSFLAGKFGGGGHAAAAGFRFRGTLDELQSTVISELSRII